MATPMLYERVSLHGEGQLGSLLNAISSSGSDSSPPNPRPSELAGLVKNLEIPSGFDLLGQDKDAWKKRLDAALDDTFGQMQLRHVVALATLLHSLVRLDIQLDFHIEDPFILLDALPQGLECLRWASVYGVFLPIPLHQLLDTLQEHPGLTLVAIPFSFNNTPLDPAYLGKAWPSIREWVEQTPTHTLTYQKECPASL